MNYISPVANEIAWHHAVEKLLGIEMTPRCKYIRTILAELARISDHLLCVGAAALDLGGFTAFLYAFNQREKIYDIMRDRLAASASTRATPASAACMRDVDRRVDRPRSATSSKTFPKAHADVVRLLNRNRIFIDRTKGIGVLSKEEAINLSCTGPIARASGVVRDLRKDEPYLAYKDFDRSRSSAPRAAIATPATWSAWTRCCESAEDRRQAAVENLPAGPVNVDVEDKLTHPRQDARSTAASRG